MEELDYMKIAIEEAKKSLKHGDIPVGAVIVKNEEIISKSHNTRKLTREINGHAEINAINLAIKKTGNTYLDDCELYVTMEPCLMCFGAIEQTNIKKISFGIFNEKFGYSKFLNRIPKIEIVSGLHEKEIKTVLNEFFKSKRD